MTPTFQDAVALHAEGRFDEAALAYRDVLRQGEHFGAAYNLSLLDASRGRYEDALSFAQEAVRLGPGSAEAHDHLGAVLVELNEHALAVPAFEAALRIEPNFARACNNLGAALQALGRTEESISWFERALALRPDYADARLNLATSLDLLERYDEAQAHLSKAAALEPDAPAAYGKLGLIASVQGRMQEAVDAFERGLARDARSGRLYHLLAGTKRLPLDDPVVSNMERLAEEADSLALEERIALHFALGKVYMENGLLDRSLDQLKVANAERRLTIDYDEAATLRTFADIATAFSLAAMRTLRGSGDPAEGHVFIIGMPRSGTTLIEQILASHPLVHGAGELDAFSRAVSEVLPREDVALAPPALRRLGSRYATEVRALAPQAYRITDKMPSNFLFAGLIHLALPKALIIHARRDPIDTCLSCFAQNFSDDQPFAYDLAELGRYYRGYERLMEHWRKVLPPDFMFEIRYEELVGNFAAEARRLIAYVGLEWDPACAEFYKTDRPVRTASDAQVRRPLYATSIGRWAAHADALRPLIEALEISIETTS